MKTALYEEEKIRRLVSQQAYRERQNAFKEREKVAEQQQLVVKEKQQAIKEKLGAEAKEKLQEGRKS